MSPYDSSFSPNHLMSDYIVGNVIGKGRKGTKVYKGYNKTTLQNVAVKVIQFHSSSCQKDMDSFRREIQILEKVRGLPNVVQLIDAFQTSKCGIIVMELLPGGDLLELILSKMQEIDTGKSPRGPAGGLTEDCARDIFSQIVKGVKGAHDRGIVHRDLKPENIFVSSDCSLKLGDWGLSAFANSSMISAGTLEYIAPEALGEDKDDKELSVEDVSTALDMWSLGCLLYVLVCARLPFKGSSSHHTAANVRNGIPPPIVGNISSSLREVISRLLQKDPSTRMTMEELINHEWMNPERNYYFDGDWKFERVVKSVMKVMQDSVPPVCNPPSSPTPTVRVAGVY